MQCVDFILFKIKFLHINYINMTMDVREVMHISDIIKKNFRP